MSQTVQLYRSATNIPPGPLLPGVLSAELAPGPGFTKLWIGSAAPEGNRLLLSSDPADVTVTSGHYLQIAGGTMLGPLVLLGDPAAVLEATPQQYVDAGDARVAAQAAYNVGRNLIHNPLFNVAQRGVGPWTTSGAYTADRWQLGVNTDVASIARAAVSDAERAAIGDEAAAYKLYNTFTGSAAAGAFHLLQQPIEGLRRISGKTITLSFWAAANAGTPKIGINYLLVYGTGGSPSAAAYVNATGQSVTLSTTWTRYSVTTAIPGASGKTFGTNGDDYISPGLWFSSGAANNATAGNIGVQSGTIDIWGVQLEVGTAVTPLEKIDPQIDLANCQRLAQTVSFVDYGYNGAGVITAGSTSLSTVMRAAPTLTLIGALTSTNLTGTAVSGNGQTVWWEGTVAAAGGYTFSGNWLASADL